ncbi:expressed unknown protein [Seminavis robusta]|uniref:Uncharacterized protein n=1 Tax=Seminavis robusta TaxID=568900 RepID=A0A9N8EZA6_9STRA|nr:expressed unknown protein [Seminavis robusta]|eukprot:Sro3072_g343220.1 n/a (366) ;mRNA; f:7035-8273
MDPYFQNNNGDDQQAIEVGPVAVGNQPQEGGQEQAVGDVRNRNNNNNNIVQAQQLGPDHDDPPSPQGPPFRMDDPERMPLTTQLHQWAQNIKEAVKAHDDVNLISDFMCAHLAIYFQGDTEAAVENALRLQEFRQDNDILDTLNDSRRAVAKLIKLFPEVYLSYSFNPDDGNYSFAFDMTKISMEKMTRTEMFTTCNAGEYYMHHAMSVDFELIRKGGIIVCECDGYDWTQHLDIHMIQKLRLEIAWTYPLQYQAQKHYNGGVMFNVVLSMLKKMLPTKIGSKFETGFQFEGRLDSIYMVPTVEAANQRLLQSLDIALQRRYELEKSFSLGPQTTDQPTWNFTSHKSPRRRHWIQHYRLEQKIYL